MVEAWTAPPIWKGERCFIIAGGASVPRTWLMENRGLLKGPVLAVKDACLIVPAAECLFYGDAHFDRERPDVFKAYTGPLVVKRSLHEDAPAHVKQMRRWDVPKSSEDRILGLCTDPTMLGGWDSGGSAINLAFHFGVDSIVLIGFDLCGRHWNDEHPLPHARMRTHMRHRDSIDAMAPVLAKNGVTVWNTSPTSTLKGFAHASLASLV